MSRSPLKLPYPYEKFEPFRSLSESCKDTQVQSCFGCELILELYSQPHSASIPLN